MKKYVLILLCVFLLSVVAVPALGAENTTVTITASKEVVERGETVEFTVSVSGDTAFTSFMVDMNFDEAYFEFVGSEENTNLGGAMLLPYSPTEREVGLAFMGGGSGTVNTWVQKLTFKIKDTAPLQKVSVTPVSPNTNTITVICNGASVSVGCDHSYPATWTKVDGEYHEKICSKCQTHDKQKHTWDEGELIGAPSCTTEGEEKYTCLDGCGATRTEKIKALGHSWDNACDPTCNRKDCGYKREISHDYSASWKSDATGHWHECIKKCGSKNDFAAHTPGPEATAEEAQLCSVCKYEIAPKVVHDHQFSTEWVSDSESHWHRCLENNPICIVKDASAPHDYDSACDIDCNTCGYIRVAPHTTNGEWRASSSGHWSVCTICNADTPVLPHIPGPEATEDTPQTCAECNFIIKMELSHVHEFSETWYSDEENHWQSCSDMRCPEVASLEAHVWDEGEELPEGGFLYTCTVCAKQLTLAEPMPTEPETTPSAGTTTNPGATQKPTKDEPKDAISWEWAGIAAIVLLIVGVVLLVIEFIRSRKTNMKGKFSK